MLFKINTKLPTGKFGIIKFYLILEKTQSIFNMIGGMRILCQLLNKVSQKLKDSKKYMELVKILLDTLTIAVTEHSKKLTTANNYSLL